MKNFLWAFMTIFMIACDPGLERYLAEFKVDNNCKEEQQNATDSSNHKPAVCRVMVCKKVNNKPKTLMINWCQDLD